MFFMAACEEALDPENKKFGWQSGQTRGDIKENSCWCMSLMHTDLMLALIHI
jgi:hypothetical protein